MTRADRPSRRAILKGVLALGASGLALSTYAFAIEPEFRLVVTEYAPRPAAWPGDLALTIAVVADIHAGEPVMPAERVRAIVRATNALVPDLIVVLGDYGGGRKVVTRAVPLGEWSEALGALKAPLGVYTILGNHDWWSNPKGIRAGLERVGLPVLENDAVRLRKGAKAFWLMGLGDLLAIPLGNRRFRGVDDLPGTLAKLRDDAPAILLVHEPDIFPAVPERVALTLAGHTHGGQVRILGYSPVVPSRYGNRFAYGHVVEDGRHLIVSGGLGVSTLPVRFGVPPEIVLVRLGASGPI